jgi:hypothetical protein
MRRFTGSFVAALAALAMSHPARAQTPVVPFATVDELSIGGGTLTVRGILVGGADPVSRDVRPVYGDAAQKQRVLESCERFALVAMSKPGQYLLFVTTESCRLARASP